jgi:hypothetical protein
MALGSLILMNDPPLTSPLVRVSQKTDPSLRLVLTRMAAVKIIFGNVLKSHLPLSVVVEYFQYTLEAYETDETGFPIFILDSSVVPTKEGSRPYLPNY